MPLSAILYIFYTSGLIELNGTDDSKPVTEYIDDPRCEGASIIFSLYASKAGTVTVLTIPPPLQLVNLRPGCTFLSQEEPILKGKLGGFLDVMIKFVHPIVDGAEDFAYEV